MKNNDLYMIRELLAVIHGDGGHLEAQVEQQQAKLNALRESIAPFGLLMKRTSGRIPTEELSLENWHELSKAWKLLTANV